MLTRLMRGSCELLMACSGWLGSDVKGSGKPAETNKGLPESGRTRLAASGRKRRSFLRWLATPASGACLNLAQPSKPLVGRRC